MEKNFADNITYHEKLLKKNRKSFQYMGLLKVFLFILFVAALYYLYRNRFAALNWLIVLTLLLIQIFFWLYHNQIQTKILFSKGMISLNQKNIQRLTGAWKHFEDQGEEYLSVDHPYGNDLDIVGPKSLFQFLNQTSTWHGRQAFADALLNQDFNTDEILKRQKAIDELSKNFNFMSSLWYHFSKIDEKTNITLLFDNQGDAPPFFKHKRRNTMLLRLPILTCILLAATFLFPLFKALTPLCILLVFGQILLWLAGIIHIHNYLSATADLPYKLNPYCDVIDLIEKQPFKAEKLQKLQAALTDSKVSAKAAIKQLNRIANRLSARHNSILYFILNVFLLWDYECILLLEKWKEDYSPYCASWFMALGELESLTCFANLPGLCSQVCLPTFGDSLQNQVQAEKLGHPLISNEERITNPLAFDQDIFIISGSNMSGKTTFLRTVGINLVLAQCGSYVCAEKLQCSRHHIVTSMRIADDLYEGISTFYAELKRIKLIIDTARNDKKTLFLIDEIFRGTNSVDRLSGAEEVLKKLHVLGVSGMITTHDLELCKLEAQYAKIRNYNFCEEYRNKEIIFDYKMRTGISQTTNARFLMELLGIL